MRTERGRKTVATERYFSPSAYVIGPKSFLSDRFLPQCDIMTTPGRAYENSSLDIILEDGTIEENVSRLGRLKSIMGSGDAVQVELTPDEVVFNALFYAPSNWAHFLCYHIPFLGMARNAFSVKGADVPVLLPNSVPKYITDACDFLGIRYLKARNKVYGSFLSISCQDPSIIRGRRRSDIIDMGLLGVGKSSPNQSRYKGAKIFVSRRGTRSITNGPQVSQFLKEQGFETFFPEELPVADQFALFEGASHVVGISGAGLAPLLMANRKPEGAYFVEIIPPGLANTFYKVIAENQDLYWIGVRGKLRAEYVPEIYDMSKDHYSKRINDPFDVCLESLEVAMDLAERNSLPQGI